LLINFVCEPPLKHPFVLPLDDESVDPGDDPPKKFGKNLEPKLKLKVEDFPFDDDP